MLPSHSTKNNRHYHKNNLVDGIKKTITMRNKIGAMLQSMAVSFLFFLANFFLS
jgi:hypothetical protein